MSTHDAVGFRDPAFVQLCDSLQELHGLRRSPASLARRALSRRRVLQDGIGAVRRLPRLTVELTGGPQSREILRNLRGFHLVVPRSVAVSVLEIPDDPDLYLRGRSKQALRTNSRRAVASGVVCRRIDRTEARGRCTEMLFARGEQAMLARLQRHVDEHIGQFWLAEDVTGASLVLALVTTDRRFARLDWMATAPLEERSDARYLLSAGIVKSLSERGVRHLAVESCLLLPPGLRHFQQRLGFQPVNVSIADRVLCDAGSPRIRGSACDVEQRAV